MSDNPQNERTSWWQTLPGMLTAGAGLITAVTGLLLAVNQMGLLQFHHPPPSTESSDSRPATNPADGTQTRNGRAIDVPSETEFHSGDTVYKLLSADLQDYSPGQKALHVRVRMTNNGRFDANFWAASFRLVVNGMLEPPLGNLDDIVDGHSSKETDVLFVVPQNTTTVGLQMGEVGEGKPTIPLNLAH